MSTVVETVEDRIQNAILTALDYIIIYRIEQAVGSLYASSGRDIADVTASSERSEKVGNFTL